MKSLRREPLSNFLLFLLLSFCFQRVVPQTVNAVKARIKKSVREVHIRRFAQIPRWNSIPSRIVGVINHKESLFVTTSTSGGLIYKVEPNGSVALWFDVNAAMIASTGRPMSFAQVQHGGLRGLAFHSAFDQNGLFYVTCMEDRLDMPPDNFTYLSKPPSPIQADSVVLEFQVNRATGIPIPTSYRQVLRIGNRDFDHPIKQLVFRGHHLYIAHGDGSISSIIPGTGQNNDGLGKILRINPLEYNGKPYRIPKSNPFNGNRFPREVWAAGFRNPHTLCFGKNGLLWAGDVGRDNIEEINIVRRGGNFGWSDREGPFVQLRQGGLISGIAPLPENDTIFQFRYPVAMFGHEGEVGTKLTGQAIATSCPIQNRSPLHGTLLYTSFPNEAGLFFSFLVGMKDAVTTGAVANLTQAKTFRPKMLFDHDDDPSTEPVEVENMREIVRMDPGFAGVQRANIRFGRGSRGEIYISSKGNGRIYLITNSLPDPNVTAITANSTDS